MPKKKRGSKLRVFKLTFSCPDCPNDQPMEAEYLDFDSSPNVEREIEDQDFAVYCPVCKWHGLWPGRRKASIRLVV